MLGQRHYDIVLLSELSQLPSNTAVLNVIQLPASHCINCNEIQYLWIIIAGSFFIELITFSIRQLAIIVMSYAVQSTNVNGLCLWMKRLTLQKTNFMWSACFLFSTFWFRACEKSYL